MEKAIQLVELEKEDDQEGEPEDFVVGHNQVGVHKTQSILTREGNMLCLLSCI